MAKGLSIGGAWLKSTDRGESISLSFNEECLKINPTECWVSLYPNERKSKPNHPDWNIVATPKNPEEAKMQSRIAIPGTIPKPFPRSKNFAPQATKSKPSDTYGQQGPESPPEDLWERSDAGPEREF